MDFAGVGIRGFRSFGDPDVIERVGPMQKIHLVVGRNNVEKSNILKFVHATVAPLRAYNGQPQDLYPGELDTRDGWPDGATRIISLGFHRTAKTEQTLGLAAGGGGLAPFLKTAAYTCGIPNTFWIDFEVSHTASLSSRTARTNL